MAAAAGAALVVAVPTPQSDCLCSTLSEMSMLHKLRQWGKRRINEAVELETTLEAIQVFV